MTGAPALRPDANILAVVVARIGDTLLATPALRALKEAIRIRNVAQLALETRYRQYRQQVQGRFAKGAPLLATVNELYDANAEWRAAWDNIKPGAVEGGDTAAHQEAAAVKAADANAIAAAAVGL